MTFEDMLNMFSVFSEAAPIGVKAKYAFRIYDKRGLGLDKKDVRDMIEKLLGGKKLEDADRDLLVEKVGQDEPYKLKLYVYSKQVCLFKQIFDEADTDRSKEITYDEFSQIVLRSPEFAK